MDLNLMTYDRSRYTVLDLLSDVGGLSGMFASIFTSFMALWNYNQLDNFMVMNLFQQKRTKRKVKTDSEKDQVENLWTDRLPNFKEYFRSLLPKKLNSCCQLSRKERAFKQGRIRLEKELNILELIKSIRLYKVAF